METGTVCYAKSNQGVALAWTTIAFFIGFAGVSAFGPIVTQLKQAMALNPLLIGLLAASPALTGSLLRIPFGAAVDRMGGKRPILILLGLAALGIVSITLLFASLTNPRIVHYPLFLISGILCGCGIAVFSVGIPTVSYWYPQRKQGTALALYAGLGNMAPGLFAFAIPLLVVSFGLTISYMIWFVLLLCVIVVFQLFMKDAPYFQYRDMGIETNKETLLSACGEELIPSGKAMASIRIAGSDWRTWILTAFYFVTFGGFIALTVWFPTYWRSYFGTSLVSAGLLTALYSLSASILRIFGGFASDRFGGERTVFFSLLVVALGSIVMMAASQSMEIAVIGVVLLAWGMGFANAAVFKLVPKYTPDSVGGSAGIVGGLGAFGGFVLPPLMGLLVKQMGSDGYPLGFSVLLGLSMISLCLLLLLNRFALSIRREAIA